MKALLVCGKTILLSETECCVVVAPLVLDTTLVFPTLRLGRLLEGKQLTQGETSLSQESRKTSLSQETRETSLKKQRKHNAL